MVAKTADRETGEIIYRADGPGLDARGMLPIVELSGETRIQVAIRELLRDEYDATVKTYGTAVEATLEMTRARADAVIKALFKEAVRDLADDVKPTQTRLSGV